MCTGYLGRRLTGYLVAPYEVPGGVAKLVSWRRISLSKRGQPALGWKQLERAKASPDFKAWWLGGGLAKSDDLDVLPLPELVKWIRDLLTDQSDEP